MRRIRHFGTVLFGLVLAALAMPALGNATVNDYFFVPETATLDIGPGPAANVLTFYDGFGVPDNPAATINVLAINLDSAPDPALAAHWTDTNVTMLALTNAEVNPSPGIGPDANALTPMAFDDWTGSDVQIGKWQSDATINAPNSSPAPTVIAAIEPADPHIVTVNPAANVHPIIA